MTVPPAEPFDSDEQPLANLFARVSRPASLQHWEPRAPRRRHRGGLRPLALALAFPVVVGAVAGGVGLHAHFTTASVASTASTTGAQPSPRSDAAFAWDAAHHVDVLFGGYGTHGDLNDTWVWDGTGWTQMHPAASPPPMSGAVMAFDARLNRLVLVGDGQPIRPGDATPQGMATWTWDGSSWHEESGGSAALESVLGQVALAYDESTHQLLLVRSGSPDHRALLGAEGEVAPTPVPLHTFAWQGGRWAEVASGPMTVPFGPVGLAWDSAAGRVTLINAQPQPIAVCPGDVQHIPGPTAPPSTVTCLGHGAYRLACTSVTCPPAHQWVWTGSAWRALPDGPFLGSVGATSLATDPVRPGIVRPQTTSIWVWDGRSWTSHHVGGRVSYIGTAIAADPDRHVLVAFGGRVFDTTYSPPHSGVSNETWTWSGGGSWTRLGGSLIALPPKSPLPAAVPQHQVQCQPSVESPLGVNERLQGAALEIDILLGPTTVASSGGSSCATGRAVDIQLQGSDGTPLQVVGNPTRVKTMQSIVRTQWSNWCGPGQVFLSLRLTDGAASFTLLHALPTCTAKGQTSMLTVETSG